MSTTPPSCGSTWASARGNSPEPTGSVPSHMGVAVSRDVSRSGSQFSGNLAQIVVTKTEPGYAANPGHAGTGTIVATYC